MNFTEYTEKDGVLTINDGVEKIPDSAFLCKLPNVTEVVVPGSVNTIGTCAFSNCTGLTKVTLLEGVSELLFSVFSDCENLTTVTLPSSISVVYSRIFRGCKKLTNVIYTGTEKQWRSIWFESSAEKKEIKSKIKEFALDEAKERKIKEINEVSIESFMSEITNMYEGFKFKVLNATKSSNIVFIYCNKNATILKLSNAISKWNENFFNFMKVFSDISKTSEEVLDSLKTNKLEIAEIKSTFKNIEIECDELKLFVENFIGLGRLNDSLTAIMNNEEKFKKSLFMGSKIKNFSFGTKIPSMTSVLSGVFKNCGIENMELPESITLIEENAFSGFKELKTIIIPDGVTKIGLYAFMNCTNLTKITLPSSLTEIRAYAFAGCKNLKELIYKGSQDEWEKITINGKNECLKDANIIFAK